MSANKERIMRNLEYVCGGITAMNTMCIDEKTKHWKDLFENWNEALYDTIELIEEDYELCQEPLKNLQ